MPLAGSDALAPRFFAGGLLSFLQACVLYAFVALGVALAAVLQVGLIWSPLIAIAVWSIYASRRQQQQQQQQAHRYNRMHHE
jgi:hypothetical protein